MKKSLEMKEKVSSDRGFSRFVSGGFCPLNPIQKNNATDPALTRRQGRDDPAGRLYRDFAVGRRSFDGLHSLIELV